MQQKIENGHLDYHICNCAGNCKTNFNYDKYRFRVNPAIDVLKNNQKDFIKKIKNHMKWYIKNLEFEKAQHIHEYLHNVDFIFIPSALIFVNQNLLPIFLSLPYHNHTLL